MQVCRADGVLIGKFEETVFQDKMRRGELPVAAGQYSYWHDGMTAWKPISEYRPPGKITNIIREMETRRQHLKTSSTPPPVRPKPPRGSILKKLTSPFRAKKKDQ